MVRNLAFVLVLLAAILPGWAQALGLGEIQLNSFLNQPLDAEIEIISSQRGETAGIKIKLASADAFERAGLEYTNVLRKLKFKLLTRRDGRQVIKVSTRKGYREPFLNFLLEVNWSNGRILREYAALVDPPTLVQSSPAQTSTPVSRPSAQARASTQKAPQQPLFGAPDTPTSSTIDDGAGFIGDTYTTQRNDTAWKIAKDARPDEDVSVEQSMMAILRANPQAFINQNINRLKAGYTLNIPDKDSMLSQSHSQALAEVRQQTSAWRNRGRSVASAPKGRLEILPPKADSDGTQAPGSSSGVAGSDDLHREAMLAREAAEAQRQENSELRLRISELEEMINNARLEASLKSDKLAALEKKLAELNADEAEPAAMAEPAAEAPVVPETAPAEEAMQEVAEEPAAVEEEKPAKPKEVVPAVPAPPGTPVNQHVVEGFKAVDTSTLPKSELPDKPFKTDDKAIAPVAAEDQGMLAGILGYFENNPVTMWIAAAAGGILVVLIGIIFMRGRRGDEQFEESILQEQVASDLTLSDDQTTVALDADETENFFETVDVEDAAVQETQAEAETEAEESSFLSDMVLSDMSEMEGGSAESDPLTEADVFLAYGRFGPAETMIKEAIAKEPERNDLRLKLLEIFYSAKNKDAFESEAESFNEDLQANPDEETWEKVAEMGSDLCPNHALFSGDAVPTEAMTETVASDEEDTEIMDFDLGEFEEQIENIGVEDETKLDESLDMSDIDGLDLDLDTLVGEEAETPDEPTMEITSELEGIADALSEEPASASNESLETTQELEVGDSLETTLEFEAAGEELETTQEIDTGASSTNEITQEIEVPDLTSELDLDETAESTLPVDTMDMDDDALADIDEVGTKLDLARAYIDMGDPEGAKSILNEVIEEGNDDQKGEAQGLMGQL